MTKRHHDPRLTELSALATKLIHASLPFHAVPLAPNADDYLIPASRQEDYIGRVLHLTPFTPK